MGTKKKARKFNAKKVIADGIEFDSQTEMSYYVYLKQDLNIAEIELQPEFEIIKPHKVECKRCRGTGKGVSDKTGKPINCSLCKGAGNRDRQGAVYTADFKVTYYDGYVEYVDIKGAPNTKDFLLRKKLFEVLKGIELIVIRWDKQKKKWKRS